MMGSSCIDIGLENIWKSWFLFRKGKRQTKESDHFSYFLERELQVLYTDLNTGTYRHGGYSQFVVTDNKRREISVASIRDKVVHRLVYQYLNEIYDRTFQYDVWSCRREKGLVGAIKRTQQFLRRYRRGYVWRADIRKFFDHIDHDALKVILSFRISDPVAQRIIWQIIESYSIADAREINNKDVHRKGIPIGNLTSQIFANIYMNEFDRYVKQSLKPRAYLRYGDDFIIIADTVDEVSIMRKRSIEFLGNQLYLEIHVKNDMLIPVKRGLWFLGVEIFPAGRRLKQRNQKRVLECINNSNISSYSGLVRQHCKEKRIKEFYWTFLIKIENEL